ncbi:sushi, von Willebrand factor type A, EGF and pentraxin domain-containing protein 1-like [Dreissena polymorpha]|uniref:sushi, von Willebrand factor type A, EGF and pentraxin domain-containing protein 1-like n=1 Tax=Dreissena polymorpha TaxID=45954 RepID=UPI0022641930|nr:sushi, von Willebrand factor type A, EGF and pentraxin domain-containing protein 1-like [Dreissena polymorpha]
MYARASWPEPIAYDDRDGAIIPYRVGRPNGSSFPNGTTLIHYNAQDRSYNRASCQFRIQVEAVTCKQLSAIKHARLDCTDGDNFGSICSYTCDKGYDMAPGSSRTLVCNAYGIWSGKGQQECIDVEPPVILTCPSTFVIGTELAVNTSTVSWKEPTAVDNSPFLPIIRLQSPIQPGSKLVAGKYGIKYVIEDMAGNKGLSCAFDVIVKGTHSCHPLPVPTNGAVVCDNWMGGQVCQLQCQAGTRMADDMLGKLLVCHLPGDWWAIDVVLPQPVFQACTNITSARLLQKLETTFEYRVTHYNGSCNDPDAQRQIAENFILKLKSTTEYKVCVDAECGENNVQILCGRKEIRKRETQTVEVGTMKMSITIPVTDFKDAQLVKQMVSNIVHYDMDDIISHMNLNLLAFESLGVSLRCPVGTIRAGSYQDNKGQPACMRCPFGTTTRHVGSTSIDNCEDACPPGSYSSDGLQPCTPCEIGSFQPSYGQNHCDVCTHSKSTASYGSQSRRDCEDSKWHLIFIAYKNCNISYTMDMVSIATQRIAGECIPLHLTGIKITSEGPATLSLSQMNVWSTTEESPQFIKCSSRGNGGDILAWKQFERADLDGSFINLPSVCDDFNNCVSSPCLNGNCTDELNSFTCHCDAGFTGQQCEVNIDDCSANVCMNNATCVDGVNSYSCACSSAFTGRFCEIAIVNGQWSEWSQWSECSATCGEGTRLRTRQCNSPEPATGGEDCLGAINETARCDNSGCNVCQPLGEIENGTVKCENMTDTIRCNIFCNEDHDFDFVPLEEYVCGPDTFHMWNFESRFNPQRRLPSCVAARAPEALSASYAARYKDLYCSTNEMTSLAQTGVEERIKGSIKKLPCVLEELCTVSYTTSSCSMQTRRKREASSIGFTIKITLILKNGEANSSMNTLHDTILAIYESAIEGVLNVTVLDDVYQVDLTGMSLSGDIQCSGNDVARSFYCIPCGKGAYKNDDQCSHCPVGQYQDEVGQASCISCPYGYTTIGEGSTSQSDCKGDKTNDLIQEAASYIGIIAGSLTMTVAAVVVIVALLVYRRYRQSMNKVSSIALLPEKENGPANQRKIWISNTTKT